MEAPLYYKWLARWEHAITNIAVKAISITGFMLGSLGIWAQPTQQDCTALKFGDFVSGNPNDSVYIYRDFSTWNEVNAKKGNSHIFDIIWIDDCHFLLAFKSALGKEGASYKYDKKDTLHYRVYSTTATSISFEVSGKQGKYKQTLARQEGLDVWAVLLNKVKDFTPAYDGIKGLLADSSKNILSQFKQLQAASFDREAIGQVEYILSLFKKGEITKMNDIALAGFKKLMPPRVLADYSLYVSNTYGKLLSYSIISSPVNLNIGQLHARVPVSKIKTYELNGQFEKMKDDATITIKFHQDSLYKIYDFLIEPNYEKAFPFVDSLTHNFWRKLQSKSFEAIYNGTSQIFKDKITYEKGKQVLSSIEEDSRGFLNFYEQSKQRFVVLEGTAFIRVQYYLKKGDKLSIITFLYVNDNGTYKIASLYYKSNKPN